MGLMGVFLCTVLASSKPLELNDTSEGTQGNPTEKERGADPWRRGGMQGFHTLKLQPRQLLRRLWKEASQILYNIVFPRSVLLSNQARNSSYQ